MNINRKFILSIACGFVLAMGLVVILVLITAPIASRFPLAIQRNIAFFIFFFSLLVIAPLVSRKLYGIDNLKKILGWTLIGTGAEFLVFPFSLLFILKSASSLGGILVITTLFVSSFVIGLLAGLISIVLGVLLIKSRSIGERRNDGRL
jgi:hypothetical protein